MATVQIAGSTQLGRVAGYPDYSSTSTNTMTPLIYAQKTLIKFYKKTFLSEITNTDYEGQIKSFGDKVLIRTVPDMTIRDYVVGQDLVFETQESPSIMLEINKAKYYAFKIEKVTEVQQDINQFEKWTADAAEQLKIQIETAFLTDVFKTNIATNTSAYNRGAAATGLGGISGNYMLGGSDATKGLGIVNRGAASTTLAAVDPIDMIMAAESVLTEQDTPQDSSRWMLVPTWFSYTLQTSELRRADGGGSPSNQGVLENGKIGRLGQFTLYVSNNLPTHATSTSAATSALPCTIIPFGHKLGMTFATQLTDTEMVSNPFGFGKMMKGLTVYGYKSVKQEVLGACLAARA